MNEINKANVMFISPQNERTFVTNILAHLSMLRRIATIELCYIDEILPGEDIQKNIKKKMEIGDMFVLILSSDFFAEDYTFNLLEELKIKYQQNTIEIMPILAYSCIWDYDEFLKKLQMFPTDKIPFAERENRESAYREVVHHILNTAKKITQSKNLN